MAGRKRQERRRFFPVCAETYRPEGIGRTHKAECIRHNAECVQRKGIAAGSSGMVQESSRISVSMEETNAFTFWSEAISCGVKTGISR